MGNLGSIPGFDPWVGEIPGEGKDYPVQYSGPENSMDCIVHGVTKIWNWLIDFHFHFQPQLTLQPSRSPLPLGKHHSVLYRTPLVLKNDNPKEICNAGEIYWYLQH